MVYTYPERKTQFGLTFSLFELSIDFDVDFNDVLRECPKCGKKIMPRLVWPELGKRTFFGLITFEGDPVTGKNGLTNKSFGLKMYVCTNVKCNNVELRHVGLRLKGEPETSPDS